MTEAALDANHINRALPAALAIALLVPVALPVDLNPGVTLTASALMAALLGAVWFAMRRRAPMPAAALTTSCAALALAVWLTARSMGATNPAVSFMGTISQHSGSALWLVIAAWIAVAARSADKRALRELLAVASISGAVFGAMAVYEALALGARAWGSAAGPLENSSSLGSYLAVTVLTSAAWSLSARDTASRALAVVSASASVAGILAADSRTGLAGVLAGTLVAMLVLLAPAGRRTRAALAVGLPLAGIAVTSALIAVATSRLGPSAQSFLRMLGTERDSIWRSVAAQLAQAPLIGSGSEQFSAWVSWSLEGGDVVVNGTYDPHNAIAGLGLAGGAVGLVLWTAFSAVALFATIGVFEHAGRPRALAVIVALPAALMGSAMFAWLTPATAVVVAMLTGALLAVEPAPPDASPPVSPRAAQGWPQTSLWTALVLGSGIVIALSVPMLRAEYAHVSGQASHSTEFVRLYDRWPDPAYASMAISSALQSGEDLAALGPLRSSAEGQATWHVDLALREIYAEQVALRADGARWPRFQHAIESGVRADPSSALWYTLAAAQADAMGLSGERTKYARGALALDPPAAQRDYLERLAATQ